jgi:DNA-binding response OmpR family regulator
MRLLIVEDEPHLAQTLQQGLRAEGYAVDHAADGLTGLELARLHPYAAVIVDIMLPRLNGYRLCAYLRREGIDVPILVLTAKDGEYDEAEALDTGADDFLRKPFSYLVLVARLRALLRRGRSVRPPIVTIGPLRLDLASRRCFRADAEVRLTAKQFAVLECLARRAGTVVSKAEVLDEVWDQAYDGDVNIVEVYVHALRRKLDLSSGPGGIETIRGVGYRLVPDAV